MRIVEMAADTGYLRPDGETMRELLAIVKTNPWINLSAVTDGPFSRAMLFVGRCFRLDQPSTKYYLSGWVDLANNFLDRCGMAADIAGDALIAAVIGAADVPYRLPDGRYGQIAELGLDEHIGRKNSNAWRLLNARPLRSPLAPRGVIAGQSIPRPKIYQEDAAGQMREIAEGEPMRWSR